MTYADQIERDHIKRIGPQTENERILLEALEEAGPLEIQIEELEDKLGKKDEEIGALEDKLDEKENEIDRLTDKVNDKDAELEAVYKQLEEA
jgi:chromosome segregation ATPase